MIQSFVQSRIFLPKQNFNVFYKPSNNLICSLPFKNSISQSRSYSMIDKMGYVTPPQLITKKQVSFKLLFYKKNWLFKIFKKKLAVF